MSKKSEPKKHKGSKKGRKSQSQKKLNKQQIRRYGFLALLALSVLGVFYVAYLDFVIRSQFEGKRWSLPARVFARPLEVYSGHALTQQMLLTELDYLNYQRNSDVPGSYTVRGHRVRVRTRGFAFWDGDEPSRYVEFQFDKNGIYQIIQEDTGYPLDLLRFEPVQIGSIYPAHKEDRDLIKFDEVPETFLKALIAVEDRDFYEHNGIKITSIFRALLANIKAGSAVQGGSTLTQQLVKNFFLTNERSIKRKAIEAVMAMLLEFHYEKEEILEAYLNEVFLGQAGDRAIHGFALASRFYYGRPITELDTAQIALLVGMVKGPSYYDPRRFPDRATERRNRVISIMQQENILTAEEATNFRLAALDVIPKGVKTTTSYPAFIDLVKRQLKRDYRDEDLRSEGLRIFTTFDPVAQNAAESALVNKLSGLEKWYGLDQQSLQGAVVITAVNTGEVLAVVGDRNPRYAGFNRALDAQRHIGSLIKPAVYLEAVSQVGLYTAASTIHDKPFKFKNPDGSVWEPQNYNGQFHGEIPLYRGLVNSYNVATARLGMLLELDNIIQLLGKMGIDRQIPAYPSLLLGAVELSPLEVSQMYQTLAANGFRVPLKAVREVLTAHNQPLQRYPLEVRQTLDTRQVFIINSMLQRVVDSGTAKAVSAKVPQLAAAGKTGTSDDLRDSWFAGFTGEHLAVVWVGRDDNQSARLSGATGAVPIWIDIMKDLPTRPLRMLLPSGMEYAWIDPETGARVDVKCKHSIELPFIVGTTPKKMAECRRKSFLDKLFN